MKRFIYRGVEQLVARRAHNPEVVGSNPSPATIQPSDFVMKSDGFLCFEPLLRSKYPKAKHPFLLDPYFDPLSAKTECQRFA